MPAKATTEERKMPTTRDTEDMEPTIMLPAVVDLAAADALLATLRLRLAANQACDLDASNVEQLMLPGIQVILAAVRSSEKLRVLNPSPSFRGAFDDAALSWVRDNETALAQAYVEGQIRVQIPDQLPNDGPDLTEAPVQSRPSQETEARTDAPRAAKRILTIDDSRTMRDMLRFTLVDAGYDVLQAVDGQDGLDVLTRERVDVVITDINMPKLDGYGVIRHLRADAGYDDTPILVLSTECDQKTKDIGRDAGATGWLVKPFDPDQLVEIVRQVSP
jgi:two-component system, chemotaxis family, chemotaxis protein CheY